MYKFEFELDDDDYIAFNRYHIHHSPASKRSLLLTRFLMPLFFIAFSIYMANKVEYPILNYSIFGVISAVWIVFFNRYCDHLLRKQIAKLKKTGKLPFGRNVSLQFEEEAIAEYTERGEQKMNYATLEQIAVDNNAVYLYIGAVQACIIPLRVFANDGERQAFLTFINAKIPKAQ